MTAPVTSKVGSYTASAVITPAALDRIESNLLERIATLQILVTERRESDIKALELQASEYERRLEALNNESTRIQKVLDASIPRETFENYKKSEQDAKELARKELQKFMDDMNRAITIQTTQQQRSATLTAMLWSLGMAIIVIIINLLIRRLGGGP